MASHYQENKLQISVNRVQILPKVDANISVRGLVFTYSVLQELDMVSVHALHFHPLGHFLYSFLCLEYLSPSFSTDWTDCLPLPELCVESFSDLLSRYHKIICYYLQYNSLYFYVLIYHRVKYSVKEIFFLLQYTQAVGSLKVKSLS